jgi:hypothetical protein
MPLLSALCPNLDCWDPGPQVAHSRIPSVKVGTCGAPACNVQQAYFQKPCEPLREVCSPSTGGTPACDPEVGVQLLLGSGVGLGVGFSLLLTNLCFLLNNCASH